MPIVIEQLSYAYGPAGQEGGARAAALCGVTLTIGEGEFLGVIGHTGSGKSTLMQQLPSGRNVIQRMPFADSSPVR